MTSHSPAQKRTMAAISHGWKPPADSPVADIPVSVAKEFNDADQAKPGHEGERKHKRRMVAKELSK